MVTRCQFNQAKKRARIELKVSPKVCYEAFADVDELSFAEHRDEVITTVRQEEQALIKQRIKDKKAVVPAQVLRTASMHVEYRPKKHGKKMICLSSDVSDRAAYISWFKTMVARCREVYRRWSKGDFTIEFPAGIFPPGGGRPRASLLPDAIPI